MLLAVTVAFFKLHDGKLTRCDDVLDAIELLRGQAGMSYDPEELIEATKQLIVIEPIARIQVQSQSCVVLSCG